MENRCQRCNRKLSDPNANYGWRCAEILGVSSELSEMGTDIFKKFTDGVTKVQKLFENSNFTDEQWKNLYSAFAKMSLWEGVNESKVKEARKEGYQVVNLSKTKSKSFSDSLKEYSYEISNKKNPIYSAWNTVEDTIWKAKALAVDMAGYHLTGDLLKLAASGNGNVYIAKEGSYASNLLKNDKGINNFVANVIWKYGESQNNPNPSIPTQSYEIPLNNGDLGASLHNVNIDVDAKRENDGAWSAIVTVSDNFDFTQFKNPFTEGSLLKGILWATNDIAYYDQKWGLLDPVEVKITYSKKY